MPKVELQVNCLINGRAIWTRAKTIPSVLTAPLTGSDYDKVVAAAVDQLEVLCRKAEPATASPNRKK